MKKKLLILILCSLSLNAVHSQSLLYRPGFVTVGDLVVEEAMKYLGTPYHWGGQTPKGFDCAGFVRFIYAKFGVSLACGARPQYSQGTPIDDKDIARGDLVFYGGRTGSSLVVGHVGIVTDVDSNGFFFIHSATTLGVSISHSKEPYYRIRYIGACRVMDRVVTNLPKGPLPHLKDHSEPVYSKFTNH